MDLQEEGEPEDSSDSDESLGLTCSPPSSPLPQNDTFPVNNVSGNLEFNQSIYMITLMYYEVYKADCFTIGRRK